MSAPMYQKHVIFERNQKRFVLLCEMELYKGTNYYVMGTSQPSGHSIFDQPRHPAKMDFLFKDVKILWRDPLFDPDAFDYCARNQFYDPLQHGLHFTHYALLHTTNPGYVCRIEDALGLLQDNQTATRV